MAIETKEREINGHVYMVTQLPARRALRLKTRLIKIFGPSLAQMLLTAEESKKKEPKNDSEVEDPEEEFKDDVPLVNPVDAYKISEMKKTSIVRGVQLLSANLDEKTFDDLCMELLQGVRRDGKEISGATIDHDFAGDLMSLYTLILFVLEVNYADFFELSGIGNQLTPPNPQAEDTKKTFTYR